jgi:hypothetical protein
MRERGPQCGIALDGLVAPGQIPQPVFPAVNKPKKFLTKARHQPAEVHDPKAYSFLFNFNLFLVFLDFFFSFVFFFCFFFCFFLSFLVPGSHGGRQRR